MATDAAGGIYRADCARARIIGNTIANNDSAGTAANTFTAGNLNQSNPQPSGVVCALHSPALAAASGQVYTDPVLADDIIQGNRSFYWDVALHGGQGGLTLNVSDPIWDLAVLNRVSPTQVLNPDNCLLTSLMDSLGNDYDDGTNGSTFTFTADLKPGTYAVYAWWTAASNRSTAVPHQIRDGATLLGTATVNQRLNGGQWNLLGVYAFNSVAAVTVVQAGGITIADAVRFAPVEVESLEITGPATVNEGSIADYEAIAHLAGGISAAVQPQTWAVDVAQASIDAAGLLTAGSVDADTPAVISAECTLNGTTVSDTLNITILNNNAAPVEVIVDNLSPGTSSVGTWNPSSTSGFYATNSVFNTTVGSSFTFPATLVPGTTYTVYGWWTAASNRYTAVPYQIRDGAILLDTVMVNQRVAGGQWNLLGTYTFTGGSASVRVVTAGAVTIADAVRFVPVTGPVEVIVDNLSSGTSSVGTWNPSSTAGFYGTNSVYSSTVGNTFTFPATLVPGTTYEVYAWWTAASNRYTAVPYQIRDGATLLGTVAVNQRLNGGQWNLLGTYVFNNAGGSITVVQAGGITIADAVRLVPVP